MLIIAKKGVFTPKMAKKWIFERGTQKIFKNEGQIRVQHEKICRKFQSFMEIYTYISLSSLTKKAFNAFNV